MVSIIIPVYNSEKYLGEAVKSALNQSYKDFEIIIIEDKSSDGTLACARELANQDTRIKVLANNENIGVVQSRNMGFDAARGEFIAFLDSDDVWLNDKLEKQITFMESNAIDLCYTAYSIIDDEGNICKTYNVPVKTTLDKMLKENVIGCSSVVIRKSLTESIKMRDEYAHEDYVMWLELLIGGAVAGGINEPLMLYRKTDKGRSYNKINAAKDRFKIYSDFLGFSLPKSILCFLKYAFNGIIKHYF